MTQKLTILFDLDGTLVDTAPDLVLAHNHVMTKFGFPTKSPSEIKALVGMGARARSGANYPRDVPGLILRIPYQEWKPGLGLGQINLGTS